MAKFMKGDVVVIPSPFSDLSQSKRRPALVLTTLAGVGTWGQIFILDNTASILSHREIIAEDMTMGVISFQRMDNLYIML